MGWQGEGTIHLFLSKANANQSDKLDRGKLFVNFILFYGDSFQVREYKPRINDIYFWNCRCPISRSNTSYRIYSLMEMYQKRQGMAAVIAAKFDTQKLRKIGFGVLGGRK